MNIADLLCHQATVRPSHPAQVFQDRSYTYTELDRLTGHFAAALTATGVEPGRVIAVLLESCPELIIAVLGALKAGVVPNIINAMLRPEEVRAVVADSGAAWLLTDADRLAGLEGVRAGLGVERTLVETDLEALALASPDGFAGLDLPAETVAYLLYTSGTTGRPKGGHADAPEHY